MHLEKDNLRCLIQKKFLGLGDHLNSPYSLILQTTIAPAGYFKDHKRLAEYVEKAVYLPYQTTRKTTESPI